MVLDSEQVGADLIGQPRGLDDSAGIDGIGNEEVAERSGWP